MKRSLGITFTGASSSGSDVEPYDLLILEQERWKSTVGVVTRALFVKYLLSVILAANERGAVDCGLNSNGHVSTVVHAWLLYPDVPYSIHASHGTLSDPLIETVEKSESLTVHLDDELRAKYPPSEIISAEWSGDVYDAEGAVTAPPTITVDGLTLRLSAPVYGSVTLKYLAVRHSYALTVPKREYAPENKFSSVVFAVHDGGITWLEVDVPPGLDSLEGVDCTASGWITVGEITAPEEEGGEPPLPDHTDRTLVYDYCNKQLVSDSAARS